MNLRRIKHTLLRLSLEEKVIGIGALAAVIGSFMPWYNRADLLAGKNYVDNAFSGDLGVIGFVIFIMSLLSVIVLVAENMHLPFPYFGFKRENILFFFLGQSAFLTLLTIAVYTKRSLDFTDAGLRFGIYLVLIGAIFAAFSAFTLIKKTRRQHLASDIIEEEIPSPEEAPAHEPVHAEEANYDQLQEDEKLTFNEDAGLLEEIEMELEQEDLGEKRNEIQEDDMLDDIQEVPQQNNPQQSNYFTKEAGLNTAPDKETNEEKKPPQGTSMNFYEDK